MISMATRSFDAPWKLLIPRDGPPRNAQGEVLRAIARIGHEVSINACASWDSRHDDLISLIEKHVIESGDLDPAERQTAAGDLAFIRAHAAATQVQRSDPTEPLARLRDCVVLWCNRRLEAQKRDVSAR